MNRGAFSTALAIAFVILAVSGTAQAQGQGEVPGNERRLPMPLGFGATIYGQTQPYDIKTLEVPLAGIDIGSAEGIEIKNNLTSMHVKFDYWVLPFLNLFVLGGQIDGSTTVDLGKVDIGLPIRLNDIKIDYSGFMYGAGLTLAYGGPGWFTTLTYQANRTDLDVSSSTVQAWVLTPKVGMTFGGAAIWIGAMYQNAQETHEGIWEMPFLGQVPYYVELEQAQPWNYQIGMTAGLSKHWVLNMEGSLGSRKAAMASIEYRFGRK